jgi:glycosyltransferase involved in cell wall biosynthesis
VEIFQLVLSLLKLLDHKFSLQLLCLCEGPFASYAAESGFDSFTIPMKHRLDITTIKPIRQFIKQQDISIVHTHGVRANLVARLAAKQEGKPVVTTVHSVLDYDYDSRLKANFARIITRLTNNKTDCFIAISGAIKNDLLKMGIPENKIELIYNGLDPGKFNTNHNLQALRERLGIKPDRLVISMIARLHPVKGQEYFLQAARIIKESGIPAQYLLVGEGISRDKLEAMVDQLELRSDVIMPGYYSAVEDIYALSDIICLPSLMEGLGLVVLEAMYFKVPVIASNVGGIPEIIKDGVNGLLVKPRDSQALASAVIRVISDQKLRNQLIIEGQKKVSEFSPENMANRVENIYNKLLQQRGL